MPLPTCLISLLVKALLYLNSVLYSSTIPFSLSSREGQIGGPEAAEMSELQLQERSSPPLQTLGPLLREACVQLPSVRGCYLSHLAHMEPSVLSSRDHHLGRTPWLNTQLLPELSGPLSCPIDPSCHSSACTSGQRHQAEGTCRWSCSPQGKCSWSHTVYSGCCCWRSGGRRLSGWCCL